LSKKETDENGKKPPRPGEKLQSVNEQEEDPGQEMKKALKNLIKGRE
jgi:hypothetical protein